MLNLQGAKKYTVNRFRKVLVDGVKTKVAAGSLLATLSIQPLTGRALAEAKEGFSIDGARAYKAYGYPKTVLRYEGFEPSLEVAQVVSFTVASSDDGLYRIEINREPYDHTAAASTADAIASALAGAIDVDPDVSASVAANVVTVTALVAGLSFETLSIGPNGDADITELEVTANDDGAIEPDEVVFEGKVLQVQGEFPNAHYGGAHAAQAHRKYVLSESDTQLGRFV